MSASAASGPTEHDSTYQYASDSYSEGGSFSAGGQSVTANFHAHDHNVNTDDGSESRPVAGGGGSNSDSGDSSDVTDDANDGNYSSVSGTLTQSGTATDDEKQTDKGQQGQSTSFAGTSSSGSQQVSGGGSDDDHAHETGTYTDVNGKLTAEDMNYTDDDITKQFNNRTDSASGLYLTSGTMTSGDSLGNSASQSYHDSGETIVSAGGADTSDKGGSHTTASASASYSFSGTFDNGGGTSGTQTLKENELDTKDDGAANYDIENGTNVSEHDTFNDAEHGDSSSVNTLKQIYPSGVSSSQSYSSGGHSDVTDNGGDDQANGATTDETDNFTDDSHSEDTSNYVTSAGGGAVANAANGVWGDWGNMPSLVQASYLWGSQVGLGDSALTYPGLAPNAVSSTANSNTDATFKHHDDGEYSLTSGTSGTSENFNDTNTYNDNASQWISAVGNYSYAGDETDTTQITQNSAVDNETDIDGGLIDAGVTTEHYKNTGGETDIASTSGTTIGTYTSGGGSASGTSFEEEISSFTETGSYATLPTTSSTSGTTSSTTGSGGTSAGGTGTTSGGGYASSSQHIVYDDNVTETLTDNGNGLESGPGVSVTGVGTYFGTASASVHSDSTHTTDASAGADTTTGNYSDSFSDNNNYSYNENGQVVVPQTQSETWSHASSYAAKDKDTESGDYSDPTGNETFSTCGAGSTSETVTWEDWSSDGSGGGHWETPPNTSFNGSTSPSSGSPSVVTTSEPGTPPAPGDAAPTAPTAHAVPDEAQFACFAAGTPVRTPTGWKAIEEIVRGDLVLASPDADPESAVEAKIVLQVYANPPDRLIGVHAGGQVIRATLHHPFYVRGSGWAGASRLRPGDQLLSHDGSWLSVTETFDNGDFEPVFNFCVHDHHTYFVGKPDWGFSVLVHNQSGGGRVRFQEGGEGGHGIPFAQGRGPVRIVGIRGNGESDATLGFTNQLVDELAGKIDDGRPRGSSLAGTTMYNSGDGNPIPGNPLPSVVGPNAQQIAQEQLTAIKNDLNNNKLKDGQVYRVLLVGYSWGADKAMDVAVELRNLIDNDAELSADVKSRIQIHLRTIDAVEKSAGALSLAMMPVLPGDRTAAVGNAVSSWYNFYQDSSFVNIKARPHGAPLGAAANDFGVPGGRADHLTIFQFISANFFASLGL